MIISNIENLKVSEIVLCICDNCGIEFKRKISSMKLSRKNWNGLDYCRHCSYKKASIKKPQCSKEYWTKEKKEEHSKKVKESEEFKKGMKKHKDMSGEKNGMYHKKHKKESLEKMIISHTGKKQSKETINKRKHTQKINRELNPKPIKSLNNKIKGFIHKELNWYKKIYEKNNFCCVECGSKKKLDAHHIEPISKIIKRLLENTVFESDIEKYNYLIQQPEIRDEQLNNGKTLCRECHKKEHHKWGSHNAESKK